MAKADFSNTEKREFPVYSPGWYYGEIEVAEPQESQKDGTPMAKLEIAIHHNLDGEEVDGGKMFHYLPLDPGCSWGGMMRDFLEGMGMELAIDPDTFCDDIVGTELWIKLSKNRRRSEEERDEYGEFQNRIKKFSAESPNVGADPKPKGADTPARASSSKKKAPAKKKAASSGRRRRSA